MFRCCDLEGNIIFNLAIGLQSRIIAVLEVKADNPLLILNKKQNLWIFFKLYWDILPVWDKSLF